MNYRQQGIGADAPELGPENQDCIRGGSGPGSSPYLRQASSRQHQVLQRPPPSGPRGLHLRLRPPPTIWHDHPTRPSHGLPCAGGGRDPKAHPEVGRVQLWGPASGAANGEATEPGSGGRRRHRPSPVGSVRCQRRMDL